MGGDGEVAAPIERHINIMIEHAGTSHIILGGPLQEVTAVGKGCDAVERLGWDDVQCIGDGGGIERCRFVHKRSCRGDDLIAGDCFWQAFDGVAESCQLPGTQEAHAGIQQAIRRSNAQIARWPYA